MFKFQILIIIKANIKETKRGLTNLAPYFSQMIDLLESSGEVLELQLKEMKETEKDIESLMSQRENLIKKLGTIEKEIDSSQNDFMEQIQNYRQRTQDINTLQSKVEEIIEEVKTKLVLPDEILTDCLTTTINDKSTTSTNNEYSTDDSSHVCENCSEKIFSCANNESKKCFQSSSTYTNC
ncbi:hypothetical protein MHBO_001721 [Bonamia ostreae]|uniref:Uncharacterized protein n=1 Tax=Bonamia ostreae TaxID=126728 RepID=A0ABV2AKR4_9EUKA